MDFDLWWLLPIPAIFFALQNAEPVTLRFYQWWRWQAPLIFMLLVAFAVGVAAGLLAGAVRSARLKRELGRQIQMRWGEQVLPDVARKPRWTIPGLEGVTGIDDGAVTGAAVGAAYGWLTKDKQDAAHQVVLEELQRVLAQ